MSTAECINIHKTSLRSELRLCLYSVFFFVRFARVYKYFHLFVCFCDRNDFWRLRNKVRNTYTHANMYTQTIYRNHTRTHTHTVIVCLFFFFWTQWVALTFLSLFFFIFGQKLSIISKLLHKRILLFLQWLEKFDFNCYSEMKFVQNGFLFPN